MESRLQPATQSLSPLERGSEPLGWFVSQRFRAGLKKFRTACGGAEFPDRQGQRS